MLRAVNNPTLVLIAPGQPRATFALAGGVTTIGRAPENIVVLNDASVSRRHAEIEVSPDRVTLRDNKSRNGVQVNGVPRREAVLSPGDRLLIGQVQLEFAAGFVRASAPPLPPKPGDPAAVAETRHHRAALPDQQQDRHLAALYHLCFRATDRTGDAEQQLLELLLDALRSKLAQYYTADCKLAFTAAEEKVRTTPKFAPYLLEKFQQLPESAAYTPADLARFQQKLGDWHFLVAPLRPAGGPPGDAVPVVVLLRPADWQEFSAGDRTLLNAAARLWPRGRDAGTAPAKSATPAKATASDLPGLMGDSTVMQALRIRLDRIAATKATVLITGETGSGKEVVAQYLHDHSPRTKAPFIKVNCAAIPAALMESELFGHAKGAFTDARSDRQGKFQLAHGGTIFLDEIGELPLPVQSKLLRVLESGEVEKLGSERASKVDVRILAATNRDLRAEVKAGSFREDLLYRLEVASAPVPPLREHAADIPSLAGHFLKTFCAENGLTPPEFESAALTALQKHAWPGNVRELRNVIQRLAMDADGSILTAAAVKRALN
ncbi:MAG: sigma 54-interacting transcriptional regulator [Lacunisphaera sp.]|nr:sigma 54-interacting transcriptional regulator [Lacunisphaera sp.]